MYNSSLQFFFALGGRKGPHNAYLGRPGPLWLYTELDPYPRRNIYVLRLRCPKTPKLCGTPNTCRCSSKVHNIHTNLILIFHLRNQYFSSRRLQLASMNPFTLCLCNIVFSRAFFYYSGPFKLDQNPGDKSLSACNVQHPGRRFLRLCDARTA